MLQGKDATPGAIWIYLIFPFVGSAMAAIVFILMDIVEKRLHSVLERDREDFFEHL